MEITDSMVKDLKCLLERATPEKAESNVRSLTNMDKDGMSEEHKFLMLLRSGLDFIIYGN